MKRFESIKAEYKEIKASEHLIERVDETMNNTKIKKRFFSRAGLSAACLCLICVTVLNVFPQISHSMADIPILSSIVKAITFERYEYKEQGYNATVVTPKIEGLLDKELEDKLNNEFKENSAFVISAFEKDVKELKKQFGDEEVQLDIETNYIVKTDNDDILALDVYVVNNVGSSSTKHTYYTINKRTGELLALDKIFEKDADYVTVISDYIKKEMKRINNEEGGMFWIAGEDTSFDGFKEIEKNHKFYINDDNKIVICFDKYEVAPGGFGCPEFILPDELTETLGY